VLPGAALAEVFIFRGGAQQRVFRFSQLFFSLLQLGFQCGQLGMRLAFCVLFLFFRLSLSYLLIYLPLYFHTLDLVKRLFLEHYLFLAFCFPP